MLYETIDLYEYFKIPRNANAGGQLTVYAPSRNGELKEKIRPAAIVCPGGGYGMVSAREAEPVCLKFLAAGYAAFCLNYTTHTAYPVPLIEAAMAAAYVRKNAKKYHVDAEKLCVVGFSAGGHLAGMLAILSNDGAVSAALKGDAELAYVNAAVLCYAVVATDPALTHGSTANIISGGDEALRERLSLEKRVTKNSAPAFIWHTFEDGHVPVENALRLASAYRAAGAACELHVFEHGIHGLSLANEETADAPDTPLYNEHVQAWLPLALGWLKRRGFAVRAAE